LLSFLIKNAVAVPLFVSEKVMHNFSNFQYATVSYGVLENALVLEKRVCGNVFQLTLFSLCESESSSDSDCDSEDDSSCSSSSDSEVFDVIAEIKRKKAHPDRLHEELWYNDPGQVW